MISTFRHGENKNSYPENALSIDTRYNVDVAPMAVEGWTDGGVIYTTLPALLSGTENYSIFVSSICLQKAMGISDWLWPHGHWHDLMLAVSSYARPIAGKWLLHCAFTPARADVSVQHLFMILFLINIGTYVGLGTSSIILHEMMISTDSLSKKY